MGKIYSEVDYMEGRMKLNIQEEKLRINIIQLVVAAIVLPLAFSLMTPAVDGYDRTDTSFFAVFRKSEHYQDLMRVCENAVKYIRDLLNHEPAAENNPEMISKLKDIILGSAVGSLFGGLCVAICSHIWKFITAFLSFMCGVWPLIPAAFCAYIGSLILYAQEKGTDTDKILYGLIAANVILIILRCVFFHTSFIFQLVKGVISVILSCAASGCISCVFCMYVIFLSGTTYGSASYLAVFLCSSAAWLLIAVMEIFGDIAEKAANDDKF